MRAATFVRNVTQFRASGQVLFEERNIGFNAAQNLSTIQLTIHSDRAGPQTNSSQHFVASDTVWREVESNKTSVYLHVVLVRSTEGIAIVNKQSLSGGKALYGVVRLIKHDKIPRSYKKRYLLSDLGMAEVSELDGTILLSILNILHPRPYLIELRMLTCSSRSQAQCNVPGPNHILLEARSRHPAGQ
jgi:hypothetical protein